MRALLLASSAIGISIISISAASAGGFALREQSAYGQGTSFAGVAAGGALSSMFWNPATMTQTRGLSVEAGAAAIFPYASHTPLAGTSAALLALGGAPDSGKDALVPNGYGAYQITPNMWIGMSFNAPFGLGVEFPFAWAGRNFAAGESQLKTYNATPSLAIKINEMISVGFGIQFQYGDVTLRRGLSAGPAPSALVSTLDGDGWGFGATAGVTITPWYGTEIGIGYRSRINQKIEGTASVNAALPGLPANVETTIRLPDMVSVGFRSRVAPLWTLMGTFEYTNWGRIGTSNVTNTATGGIVTTVPLNYRDGYMVSFGAEYQWRPELALRAGVGYESSPVTDAVRTPLIPDNDRIWLSLGATYQATNRLKFDVAYSHLFVQTPNINITTPTLVPGAPATYVGTVNAHVDIVSVALRYSWYDDPPARRILPTK